MRRFKFFTPENTKGKLLKATTMGLATLERGNLVQRLSNSGFTKDSFDFGLDCATFFRVFVSLE